MLMPFEIVLVFAPEERRNVARGETPGRKHLIFPPQRGGGFPRPSRAK
jgi:hypothetical protein